MKRISIAIFSLMVFASMSNVVNYDSEKSSVDGLSSSDYNDGNYGKIKAMYGDVGGPAITDENGGMGFGCIFLCTPEDWIAFISFIFLSVVLLFWIFRKLWKFGKKILFTQSEDESIENEEVDVDQSLGGHLPVTEKELFEFRVNEIKKRRRREEKEEEERDEKKPFDFKEEFVIFSVFVSIALILIFGFDIFSSH